MLTWQVWEPSAITERHHLPGLQLSIDLLSHRPRSVISQRLFHSARLYRVPHYCQIYKKNHGNPAPILIPLSCSSKRRKGEKDRAVLLWEEVVHFHCPFSRQLSFFLLGRNRRRRLSETGKGTKKPTATTTKKTVGFLWLLNRTIRKKFHFEISSWNLKENENFIVKISPLKTNFWTRWCRCHF